MSQGVLHDERCLIGAEAALAQAVRCMRDLSEYYSDGRYGKLAERNIRRAQRVALEIKRELDRLQSE